MQITVKMTTAVIYLQLFLLRQALNCVNVETECTERRSKKKRKKIYNTTKKQREQNDNNNNNNNKIIIIHNINFVKLNIHRLKK